MASPRLSLIICNNLQCVAFLLWVNTGDNTEQTWGYRHHHSAVFYNYTARPRLISVNKYLLLINTGQASVDKHFTPWDLGGVRVMFCISNISLTFFSQKMLLCLTNDPCPAIHNGEKWRTGNYFGVLTSKLPQKIPEDERAKLEKYHLNKASVSSLLNFILIWFTEDAQRLQNISYENTRLLAARQKAEEDRTKKLLHLMRYPGSLCWEMGFLGGNPPPLFPSWS